MFRDRRGNTLGGQILGRPIRYQSRLGALDYTGIHQPVKRFLQRRIDRREPGPSADVLANARTYLWGEVKNATGVTVTATLETPQGYRLTALSAVECAHRAAAGQVPPGAWTPSKAFGADFVTELPGVVAGEPRQSADPK